jgi:hypothetical protein
VNNRFVRLIKSGEVGSIEDLKSRFKALAKLSHPDLHGPAAHEDFIRVRGEYDAALRDFNRHRFGFAAEADSGPIAFDRGALYASLVALFKRGFPKLPRHEKERGRYEYCVSLARSQLAAWNRAYTALFESFGSELLSLKATDGRAYDAVLDLVLEIFDYHQTGIGHARTAVEMAFDRLSVGGSVGAGIVRFLGILVEDMGEGPAFSRRA